MTLIETTHASVQPVRICEIKLQSDKRSCNATCESMVKLQTEKETVIQPVKAWLKAIELRKEYSCNCQPVGASQLAT